jgi:hypothetical protein
VQRIVEKYEVFKGFWFSLIKGERKMLDENKQVRSQRLSSWVADVTNLAAQSPQFG